MAYLLDANVFIQAKNLHYGFDFCPAFWEWLDEQTAAGNVVSIEQVGDELLGGDELGQWATNRRAQLFPAVDAPVLQSMSQVSAWANGGAYNQAAVSTFLQIADSFLVASGMAHGHTVVTHEIPANSPKKIKIPNACQALGVSFCTPYQMLRREKARFVLGKTA